MINYDEKTLKAIETADQEIQNLINSALEKRLYQEMLRLIWVAERIADIKETLNKNKRIHSDSSKEKEIELSGYEAKQSQTTKVEHEVKDKYIPTTQKAYNEISRKGFPFFVREGDSLVKIGSSNIAGATYEHRAPKQVIDTILQRILKYCNANQRPLTSEKLSDLQAQDGESVPGYQLYLCLGWLKREKLIKQIGRKGYKLVDKNSLVNDVENAWIKLDEHD
jgi:hypothetical protein